MLIKGFKIRIAFLAQCVKNGLPGFRLGIGRIAEQPGFRFLQPPCGYRAAKLAVAANRVYVGVFISLYELGTHVQHTGRLIFPAVNVPGRILFDFVVLFACKRKRVEHHNKNIVFVRNFPHYRT